MDASEEPSASGFCVHIVGYAEVERFPILRDAGQELGVRSVMDCDYKTKTEMLINASALQLDAPD